MSDFPIIKPLLVGVFPNFETSTFLYGKRQGQKEDFPCIMFLIEVNGKKIVVDTGPCDSEKASKYHTPIIQTDEMQPYNALTNIGINPEEVDYVVLSHLHWDHCSNCKMFKNARFFVQKAELSYAIAPSPLQKRPYEIGFDRLPSWMDVFQQMEPIEGDLYDLVKGVHLVTLPGHTPGLMGVLAETKDGVYAIASDCVPLNENWEGDGKLKHIPNGIHINLEEYEHSFDKLDKLAKVVLAAHDFKTLNKNQYP
ncbi:N-acyl homoserine lactonase family protein [Aquibacillus saliphilus]|uniref:N-acyl homoserine lactonase family protein n=1 Tax=Aquibacillus saliphilus TaxID=1909422 RepID=UPI001CF04B45|nr:N-acyl homoserine lactonase family protein [Aquibacillus saliphilus]